MFGAQLAGRGGFEYIRPPVQQYGILDWHKCEEMCQVGYDYMLPKTREWTINKAFPCLERNEGDGEVDGAERVRELLSVSPTSLSGGAYCSPRSPTSDWSKVHHYKFATSDED